MESIDGGLILTVR